MSQFPPGKSWSLFSTPLRWSQSNEEDSNMILVMHIMVMMTQVSHKTQYVIKKAGGNVTLDCTDFTGEQEAAWRKIGGVATLCLIICSRVKVWKITNSAKLYLSILLLRKRYVALNGAEEHSFQELFSLTFNILLSIRGHRDIIISNTLVAMQGTPNNWLESAFATQFWHSSAFYQKKSHYSTVRYIRGLKCVRRAILQGPLLMPCASLHE